MRPHVTWFIVAHRWPKLAPPRCACGPEAPGGLKLTAPHGPVYYREKFVTQPRSSLALALLQYRGIRPGIAPTIAAGALIVGVVVGSIHLFALGQSGTVITEGQGTLRALHSYNTALERWLSLVMGADSSLDVAERVHVRDSVGIALRVQLREFQFALIDSVDRMLVNEVLGDVARPGATEVGNLGVGVNGRRAMIELAARQDSALFAAMARYHQSQILAAFVLGLTVVAAAVLVVPMSWMYLRYKQGIPPGL